MGRYLLKRLFMAAICVVGVSVIIFVAIRLTGDPTLLLLPEDATEQDFIDLRKEMGIDKPIPIQYWIFMKQVAHGNFGESVRYKMPALKLVLNRFPATLQLGLFSFVISVSWGLFMGVSAARLRGSPWDQGVRVITTAGLSLPTFWIGIMAILIFAVNLGWLPTSGRGTFWHFILPAVAMAAHSSSSMGRITRSSMLNVLGSDYIKMARVKGNPEWRVNYLHGLKNASIPVVTLMGLQLATKMSASVVIESIFAWPGCGKLILDAIYARDYAVVQAGVSLMSLLFIGINVMVDLLYGFLDPRIRYD